MKLVNGTLAAIMVLFAVAQYNDPDYYLWIPVYLVPAGWLAASVLRPAIFDGRGARLALWACLALSLVATVANWPQEAGFWRKDVWWQSELAREGMGLMIVTVCLALAALTASRRARN